MIIELREMGLNQVMIAREMKVSRQAVNQWFDGSRTPTLRTVKKIAVAMSELTGQKIVPVDVYDLIEAISERKAREA